MRDDADVDREEDVRDPAVPAPVEERHEDRLVGALRVVERAARLADVVVVGPRLPVRRLAVEVERLARAEDVEADGDARAEDHREPRQVVVSWLLVLLAELEVAVFRDGEIEEEDEPDVLREDVEVREVLRDPRLALDVERLAKAVGVDDADDDEAPEEQRGESRDDPVHLEEVEVADLDAEPAPLANVQQHRLLIEGLVRSDDLWWWRDARRRER